MKPYYERDGITTYHGNSFDIVPRLTYDAVVTDPPYGVRAEYRPHGVSSGERVTWDDSVPYEFLTEFGQRPVLWFGAASKIAEAYASFATTPRMLVWAPRFTLSMTAGGGIAYRFHPIYAWNLPNQSPTIHDVMTDNTEAGNWWDHPATKPVALMRRLVQMVGGGVILDPFMGSGTTLRAAADCGLQAIGVELSEEYCEIAVERLRQGALL